MTSERGVFDTGLQLERTALAWQRTLLSLAAGSLAIGRGLLPAMGATSWILAGVGVTTSVVLFVVTRRRYAAAHKYLTAVDATSLPTDARLIAVCAVFGLLTGLAALTFVLHEAF